MKRTCTAVVLLLTVLAFPAFAGTFDLGLTVGTSAHSFVSPPCDTGRLRMAWGLTAGLTDTIEFDIDASSQLVPAFFGDTNIALMIRGTLLGARSTGTEVAGIGINSLFGAGVLFSDYAHTGTPQLSHIVVSVTPITVGGPILGKRERFLTCALAYDIHTQGISLIWNIIQYDYYAVGTYRDYR